MRMANLYANACQVGDAAGIAECYRMITSRAADILKVPDYGIGVGKAADLVVFDCENAARRSPRSRRAVGVQARPHDDEPRAGRAASAMTHASDRAVESVPRRPRKTQAKVRPAPATNGGTPRKRDPTTTRDRVLRAAPRSSAATATSGRASTRLRAAPAATCA